MSWLADNCPRLARARDDLLRHREQARQAEIRRTTALLEWQRVLAHRELQLQRAFHTRSLSYIRERERKLEVARQHVARLSIPARAA